MIRIPVLDVVLFTTRALFTHLLGGVVLVMTIAPAGATSPAAAWGIPAATATISNAAPAASDGGDVLLARHFNANTVGSDHSRRAIILYEHPTSLAVVWCHKKRSHSEDGDRDEMSKLVHFLPQHDTPIY